MTGAQNPAPDPKLISVVIPARNAASTLPETLDSLLAQTYPRWEALIVDDGSTDETAGIIASYAARDTRFTGISGPHAGVAAARNAGLARAAGTWLNFLDADDWLAPAAFEKFLGALRSAPDAVAAYGNLSRVMPDGGVTLPYAQPQLATAAFELMAQICAVQSNAVLVNRDAVTALGGFDSTLSTCEDWDLWQRLARIGRPWRHVDETIAFYRASPASLTSRLEPMLDNGRIVIARGFAADERLAGLSTCWPNGLPETPERNAALAFARYALWHAAYDSVTGGTGIIDGNILAPLAAKVSEAGALTVIVFDAVMVGRRALPAQLGAAWPHFGPALGSFLAWLGEVWQNPGLARSIQYRLENNILYAETLPVPRRLGLTQGLRFDVAAPPAVAPPPGIDRIQAHLTERGRLRGIISCGALGTIGPGDWRRMAVEQGDIGYRTWRRQPGPAADFVLLREMFGAVRRDPRILGRPAALRAALKIARRRTMLRLTPADQPPSGHTQVLRAIIRAAGASPGVSAALAAAVPRPETAAERRTAIPVLLYPAIAGSAALAPDHLDPAMFLRQIRWLRAHGYHGVDSSQLETLVRQDAPAAGRPVMLSFDDGLQSFADQAWPILRDHGFCPEVFIVTAGVGEPPLMTPGTIARLATDGVRFGSHTHTRRAADGLSTQALAEELAVSRARLADWLGTSPASLSLPYGVADNRVKPIAAACGYRTVFTGHGGPARTGADPFDLPRLKIRGDRPFEDFVTQMESML
jgi:peptidoglycan/xylan/chitin deacetylase (PgdA/CDA1 family)